MIFFEQIYEIYKLWVDPISFFVIAIPIIVTILYDKRDPIKALSWIIIVTIIPILGFIFYMLFGRNFRKRRIFVKKVEKDTFLINRLISKQLYEINSAFSSGFASNTLYRDIATLLLNNDSAPITYDNDVTILYGGEDTFIEISEAIKGAKSFIHLEYYIIRDDAIGNSIADLLIAKAKDGVEVRIIYDDVGCWGLSREFIQKIKDAGIEIYPFLPVIFPFFTRKINNRNHRKILIVDGIIGFTGGINIADKYIVGTPRLGSWRDTHLKIMGSAVSSLQIVFIKDWNFVSKKSIDRIPKYFKRYANKSVKGNTTVQIASSGPDSSWASIMQVFFAAITKAKDHIYISTPYFLPNESVLTAIKVAALSGIDVKIIIPGRSDSKIVYWATRSYITELLDAGVKVYLYLGGFTHAKILTIDSQFSSVGSANMDIRSFEDNFELLALLYNKNVTEELERQFMDDIKTSRMIDINYWINRPKLGRTYEALSRLLSPLL